MTLFDDNGSLAPAALAAVIAHSQIMMAAPARPAPRFPAGFDDVDIAILEWIAAEGRQLGGRFPRI